MARDQIKVKLSPTVSVVAPLIPTVRHRMFLSSLDIFWITNNNIRYLFFYKTRGLEEFSTIVETLKGSLSSVLVDFYPFAGRLDIQAGDSSRPEVDCNDGSVKFVEASIDVTFQELEKDDFQHKRFFEQLAVMNESSYDAPLLTIQVTAFLGGGICIGTTDHHAIADANSFWYFMKCWADRSKGLPISKKPEHKRTVFKRDKKNYALPMICSKVQEVVTDRVKGAQILKFLSDDSLPVTLESPMQGNEFMGDVDISIEISMQDEISTFHFSGKMIQNLKERAQASSSFVGVAAHFWRCVMEARRVPDNQPVRLLVLADCRDQVIPPLPSTYFGNCICPGVAQTTAKQLLEGDMSFAAGLIEEVIKSCKSEVQLNNYIDWIESRNLCVFDVFDHRYCFNVVGSPRYPVYDDIDFGWGKPLSVQPATINEIGAMVLVAGRAGGGSIDVSTRLPRDQMETLKRILTSRAEALPCRL